MFVAAQGWALRELVIVKKEVMVLKVEKNVWGIKVLGQKMVGLVWINPTINIMMNMKPMLFLKIRLNPKSRGWYQTVHQIQIQVRILPLTKLVSHCLRDSDDDEMSMKGISLAVQVTKYTHGQLGIETLGTRIPKSSIFSTLVIKTKSTLIRGRMCIKILSLENNIITKILQMKTKKFLIRAIHPGKSYEGEGNLLTQSAKIKTVYATWNPIWWLGEAFVWR